MIKDFSVQPLDLEGAYLIKPFVAYDERGYLIKDYAREVLEKNNIHHDLQEVFYSESHKGVIRGIHFQSTREQAKLVRCVHGSIFDVIVDLRKNSGTFGQWRGFYLSEESKDEIYVPKSFGHGFLALEPSIVSYKCNEKFHGEYDYGIKWDDPIIGIDWPLDLVDEITVSKKDSMLQSFADFANQL